MRFGILAVVTALSALTSGFAADTQPTPAPKPAAPPAASPAKPAPAHTVTGTVTGPDGKPVTAAVVRAIAMPPKSTASIRGPMAPDLPKASVTKTDASGAFKLELSAAGAVALRVMAPGLAPASATDVPPGAVLNLRLRKGFPVVGRVVDLTSQKPVAGATVTGLERDAARFGRDAAHTATTADDGTFQVSDCAPGVVVIEAIAPAKARARLDRAVARAVAPGEERKPEENTLYLQPGGRISGRVTGPDGKPLADATVTASPSDGSLMAVMRDGRASQRTDTDGKFSFDGIVAGNKYTLRATKEGLGSHEEGPIPIEAGTERNDLDLKLDSAASLTFRLVTSKDVPVKDVGVRLQPQGGGRRRGFGFASNDVDSDRIVPQGDGKFLVKPLDPGTFDLTLQPADYADVTREGIRLRGGETIDLGTLRVRESKSVGGRITDATGQPIEGATIFGMSVDADVRLSREARSGADGRYRISGLGDSPLRNLSVRAVGYADANREGAIPGDNDVDFTLDKTGSVVGKVQLRGGGVPAAFRVQAFPEAKEAQERPGFRIVIGGRPDDDQVFTDPAGNFRLDNIDPGIVTINARTDGKAPARKTGLKVVSDQVTDAGTLILDDGRALRGRVVAAKDEAPIPGATVSVSNPQGMMMRIGTDQAIGVAITAMDGHFEIAGLEARTYAIDASQPDYSANSGRVDIAPDADTDDFVIKLSRGGTVTGLVRDGQKVPIPNVGVLLTKIPMSGGPQTVTTGPDGRYTFEKVPPGDYTVLRAPTNGGPLMLFAGMGRVTVQEGVTTTYDLDEAAKINVTGRVTKGGQPVANSMMFFSQEAAGAAAPDLKQSRTDADGRYQIGLNAAGAYTVVVSSSGGMIGMRQTGVTVQVPDQPDAVVDVTLRSSGISGKVTNTDGKPVSGAVVAATPTGSSGSGMRGIQSQTEPDGSFLIDGIPPGNYGLSVAASGYKTAQLPPVTIANESDLESVDVRLDPGRTVHGHVFDANGNGIANAMVLTAPAGSPAGAGDALRAMSDVNGAFVVTAPAEGAIDMTAVADGFPPARAVSLQPEDGADIALRAPRPARVRVNVIDDAGNAVANARVSYRAVPDYLGAGVVNFASRGNTTGPDGATTLFAMGPGGYELTVSSGPRQATQAVSVAEGGEAVATIKLP